MKKRQFGKGTQLPSTDLSTGQDYMEDNVQNLVKDAIGSGFIGGVSIEADSPVSWNIVLPVCTAYCPLGNRMDISIATDIDMEPSTDPGTGDEYYIRAYMIHTYSQSEGGVDEDGIQYYKDWQDSYTISTVEGTEAPSGTATKPSVPSNAIVIADVLITATVYDRGNIILADIDTSSQDIIEYTGLENPLTTDLDCDNNRLLNVGNPSNGSCAISRDYADTRYVIGSGAVSIKTITTDYVIQDSDSFTIYEGNMTASGAHVTLPSGADNTNEIYKFSHIAGNNVMIIECESGDEISADGLTEIHLSKPGDYLELYYSEETNCFEILNENISTQLRLDTYAGYGSTDNCILKYSTSIQDLGNMLSHNHGSYGTDGLEITINKSGKWAFLSFFAGGATLNVAAGLSLNSSQLTTALQSITITDIMGIDSAEVSGASFGSCSWSGYLDAGDIVRPHGNTIAPNGNLAGFIATYIGG